MSNSPESHQIEQADQYLDMVDQIVEMLASEQFLFETCICSTNGCVVRVIEEKWSPLILPLIVRDDPYQFARLTGHLIQFLYVNCGEYANPHDSAIAALLYLIDKHYPSFRDQIQISPEALNHGSIYTSMMSSMIDERKKAENDLANVKSSIKIYF